MLWVMVGKITGVIRTTGTGRPRSVPGEGSISSLHCRYSKASPGNPDLRLPWIDFGSIRWVQQRVLIVVLDNRTLLEGDSRMA